MFYLSLMLQIHAMLTKCTDTDRGFGGRRGCGCEPVEGRDAPDGRWQAAAKARDHTNCLVKKMIINASKQ